MEPLRTSIHADSLVKNGGIPSIHNLAKTTVRTIDSLITLANRRGEGYVKYNLPNVMDVQGMRPEDARLILYGRIINAYDTGGYLVTLDVPSGVITLTWQNGMTDDVRESLKNYVSSFSPNKK